MKLSFNNKTKKSEPIPNVVTRVPGFSGTHTVEWLDESMRFPSLYFATLVDALVSWGYRRGKSVVGAPYDFRKAPHELNDYFIKLRTLIEMTYRWNGNNKVVVVGHSMGNLVMNHFYHHVVDQQWKDKFLKSHFSLSAPWGGAMQIVKLLASGYNLDYYRIVLSPIRLRAMQRTFTSSAYLFPSEELWPRNESLLYTDVKNYTTQNIKEFFDDIDYPIGYQQYLSTRDADLLKPPGVEVHCIYGTEVITPEQFFWKSHKDFPDSVPTTVYGNGDGTVNIRSLRACSRWKDRNNGTNINVTELNGADHMSILRDPRTITLLRSILYN